MGAGSPLDNAPPVSDADDVVVAPLAGGAGSVAVLHLQAWAAGSEEARLEVVDLREARAWAVDIGWRAVRAHAEARSADIASVAGEVASAADVSAACRAALGGGGGVLERDADGAPIAVVLPEETRLPPPGAPPLREADAPRALARLSARLLRRCERLEAERGARDDAASDEVGVDAANADAAAAPPPPAKRARLGAEARGARVTAAPF